MITSEDREKNGGTSGFEEFTNQSFVDFSVPVLSLFFLLALGVRLRTPVVLPTDYLEVNFSDQVEARGLSEDRKFPSTFGCS